MISRRGVTVVLVAFVLAASLLAPGARPVAKAVAARPNIVLIVTDDQRWDTMAAMPIVRKRMGAHGVTFSNAFVVNPTCCPSRASILTGAYSHSTKVYNNYPPYGGFESFGPRSTIATWLRNAGYRTALIGKYLNGYTNSSHVPPGWDRWVAFTDHEGNGAYYGFTLAIDGKPASYGGSSYSTDVLAAHAASFIRGTAASRPLFLYFTPKAPHQPADPAARHAGAFSGLPAFRPPNYNEADVSDKPAHVRALPLLSATDAARIDETRRDQHRTLLAADEAVGKILDALSETGRLANTLIVFTSDNGFAWGEHRWKLMKFLPYEEDMRVPLIVRYDRLIGAARTDKHLALNIDFAPTFAAAAGASAPGAEGRNLLPLLSSTQATWRNDFLVEHLKGVAGTTSGKIPSYCAVRKSGFKYVAYQTGEEELYDLSRDPYELNNRAKDGGYAATLSAMRSRVRELCDPPPPGFAFP